MRIFFIFFGTHHEQLDTVPLRETGTLSDRAFFFERMFPGATLPEQNTVNDCGI